MRAFGGKTNTIQAMGTSNFFTKNARQVNVVMIDEFDDVDDIIENTADAIHCELNKAGINVFDVSSDRKWIGNDQRVLLEVRNRKDYKHMLLEVRAKVTLNNGYYEHACTDFTDVVIELDGTEFDDASYITVGDLVYAGYSAGAAAMILKHVQKTAETMQANLTTAIDNALEAITPEEHRLIRVGGFSNGESIYKIKSN